MNIIAEVKNNTIISHFKLSDGPYLINIISLANTDITTLQKKYFLFVQTVSNDIGEQKKYLHEEFKNYYNTFYDNSFTSTKELETIKQWIEFIERFKEYSFKEYDILL